MSNKFVYVIEDGEIIEKVEVKGKVTKKLINELCMKHFGCKFLEIEEESGGELYVVSDLEYVFVCEKDVEMDKIEELWDKME